MILGIAVAGAFGAVARYGLDRAIGSDGFPWGIFVVNVSGAFELGVLLTAMSDRGLRTAVTVGFLGAYTTFSTLSFQTYRLAADGSPGLAAANMLGSCAAGLAAVYLGVLAGRAP